MWKLGIAGLFLFPILTVAITYWAGMRASEVDPTIGGAYVASLFFSVPFSAIVGFSLGMALGYFLQ